MSAVRNFGKNLNKKKFALEQSVGLTIQPVCRQVLLSTQSSFSNATWPFNKTFKLRPQLLFIKFNRFAVIYTKPATPSLKHSFILIKTLRKTFYMYLGNPSSIKSKFLVIPCKKRSDVVTLSFIRPTILFLTKIKNYVPPTVVSFWSKQYCGL